MPTSLTYIILGLEAANLGDLLRISVRSTRNDGMFSFSRILTLHTTPQRMRCSTGHPPLSLLDAIQGENEKPLRRKENSSRVRAKTSEKASLRYRLRPDRLRNFDLIPFRRNPRRDEEFVTQLRYYLGPANSCPNAVDMKPYSTSVFKGLI